MDLKGTRFYIDRFWKISYPYTILSLLAFVTILDFSFSLFFHLQFLPEGAVDFMAYLMRLSSIVFAFVVLRTIYYKVGEMLSDLAKIFYRQEIIESLISLKNNATFLNSPLHHLLAGILANALYLVVLYSYVFPVLKWSPYHVFSNGLWVGVLGVGCYLAIFGIRFVHRFLITLRFHRMVDIYHEDTCGGLTGVSRFLIEFVVLSGIATGLWIGSIPYAFKYSPLWLILFLGLVVELLLVIYIISHVHFTLSMIKREKIRETFSVFHKAHAIRDFRLPLGERVDLLIELTLAQFALTNAYRLRVFPIDYKVILEILGALTSFLPVILQYLLYVL